MDRISSERRSENMRRIRTRNTAPELVVRNALRQLGVGYRLHRTDLPGKPDIVMAGRRIALFVHGCYWHRHPGCPRAFVPTTRQEYWLPKLAANVERDRKVQRSLEEMGWTVVVVWECETRAAEPLRQRLAEAVGEGSKGRRQ